MCVSFHFSGSLSNFPQLIQKNFDDAHRLGTKVHNAWTKVETSFVEYALLQKRQYEDSIEYIKKVNTGMPSLASTYFSRVNLSYRNAPRIATSVRSDSSDSPY